MSFLDVDRTELENRLLINQNEDGKTIDSLLENMVNKSSVPTKLVTPIPGLCVKTFTKSGEKVFINVCHTEEIPRPTGITIPLSIGFMKTVTDKSGKACMAFDIALNSSIFDGNSHEIMIFTVMEAVSNKHMLDLQENRYHILKNMKCKGKIDPMHIEQRAVRVPRVKPWITEVSPEKKVDVKPLVPDYNLIKVDGVKDFYASEIDLKGIATKNNISLLIGEDRLHVSTNDNIRYELEYHFPEDVDHQSCTAEFDSLTQVLTIIVRLKKLT